MNINDILKNSGPIAEATANATIATIQYCSEQIATWTHSAQSGAMDEQAIQSFFGSIEGEAKQHAAGVNKVLTTPLPDTAILQTTKMCAAYAIVQSGKANAETAGRALGVDPASLVDAVPQAQSK